MPTALVNGLPVNDTARGVSLEERGLAYGDGLFETLLLRNSAVRFLNEHLLRLQLGCERLGIAMPTASTLRDDIKTLVGNQTEGIVKLIVTRGAGGRGYRASGTETETLTPTRIALLYPPIASETNGIAIRWCETRLARNATLAGIKHLNRLEQVLAQNEWRDPAIAEGLMLDTEGEVVCATASNVFLVTDGVLATPDLRFSGVRGVMRGQVLAMARRLQIETNESALRPEDVLGASEVFLTNAVRGIRPVCSLGDRQWRVGPITQKLMQALESGA